MNLPKTNNEKLKLALDILVTSNGERTRNFGRSPCPLNKNAWKNDKFILYQGAGTCLLVLYHSPSELFTYPFPDKESPHFAPLTLLLKVIAPYFYEEWIEQSKSEQNRFISNWKTGDWSY